jgi:hypothetical protein
MPIPALVVTEGVVMVSVPVARSLAIVVIEAIMIVVIPISIPISILPLQQRSGKSQAKRYSRGTC